MEPEKTGFSHAADTGQRPWFGKLPERIRPEQLVAVQPATVPDPVRDTYSSDDWLTRTCL
ncbi:hypothetical protein ABT075_35105 [Streptomyces sp. NPDC002677]|uniref:hypothetical protein n=1 Tax=Streptomyces sp. NPDC002677 TaxID=3154774 RepID=UPI0033191789